MPKKYLDNMIGLVTRSSLAFILLFSSCANYLLHETDESKVVDTYDYDKKYTTKCTLSSKVITYERGDLPCLKEVIQINSKEKIKIHFKVTDKSSKDLYEHGYQELIRYKDKKIVQTIKLRRDEDAYWSEVPFVRIRKQKYLSDLDGDGFLEFAVFPFSSGSAIWGTVRIFSLKDKIEYWGKGKYQFEGDTFVQLNCPKCSKFNPDACKSCS